MSPRILLALALAALGLAAPAQIVIDNSDPEFTRVGFPNSGAFGTPWGADYHWTIGTGAAASETARWTPNLPSAGLYQVEVYYVAGGNRPIDAPYTAVHASGSTTVDVNQEINGETWVSIGTYQFNAGTGGHVELSNACEGGQAVIADAVRFTPTAAAGAEIRGVWQSRFQWASATPASAQASITGVLDNMLVGNFNTIFLQIRGQADTLYPSPNEPWSPLVTNPDGVHPGWDPAAFAVAEAHSRGIQIHAYINTHTAWAPEPAPTYADGSNATIGRHIYWDHANPNDANARDWLLHDGSGNPAPFSEYHWFNPGVPAMDAYVREQIMYVVSTYDFDGLHFDRIRQTTPGYGRAPIAVDRWDDAGTVAANDGRGNPENLGWEDFMRDAIDRAAVNIAGEAWLLDPSVVISSAPLGLYDASAYSGYPSGFYYGYPRSQDAKAWMELGAMDFIVPQIYWPDGGALPDYSDLYFDWQAAADAAGRALVPASRNSDGQANMESHALIARANGAAGFNLWHSANTNWSTWSSAGKPYETPAAVPTFPWRSTEGVICGRVYGPDGTTPVTDAWINRNGETWTALSSADGFYAFLRVPPGNYTLTADHPDHGQATATGIVVNAGQATEIDLTLNTIPVRLSVLTQE